MALKDPSKKSVNLNLSKLISLKYYTKMKHNIIYDEDREGFFRDIETNKTRQKVL